MAKKVNKFIFLARSTFIKGCLQDLKNSDGSYTKM